MVSRPTPDEALSPEAFYSLYCGGLSLEDEHRRVQVGYVLLLMGRLGLRPGELLHLHEGWIDWRRGEIHVPGHDPCACRGCWERAGAMQRSGDGRSRAEIVADDCWTPPGEDGERTLAFAWSKRLTAVLANVLENSPYLDVTVDQLRAMVEYAANNAVEVDADAVSLRALRASAMFFLARAGFGPRRLADLFVVSEEVAGEFAREGGGDVRNHLYRTLEADEIGALCGQDSDYRLACDPTPFEREPFDPREYDEWRLDRAEQSRPVGRNPRPADPPEGISFDPQRHLERTEPTENSGSGILATSLAEWVQEREAERLEAVDDGNAATLETGGESASARAAEAVPPDAEPQEWLTGPIEFSADIKYVSPEIENGRPTGGEILLGQDELLLLARDDTGVSEQHVIPLDSIVNIAPGYVPEKLDGIFENTVGIAYRLDGDKKVAVLDLSSTRRREFQTTLFGSVLEEVRAVVVHPARRGGNAMDSKPQLLRLEAPSRRLRVYDPDTGEAVVTIRLSAVVEFDETRIMHDDEYRHGLAIRFHRADGPTVTTQLAPLEERYLSILKRFVLQSHNRRKLKIDRTRTTPDEREILEALHTSERGTDLTSIFDRDTEELTDLLSSLKEKDLVEDTDHGVALSGLGKMLVVRRYDGVEI